MTVVAYGYSNPGNPQEASKRVDHAECACCPIEWSPQLGWQYNPREDGCEHVDFECINEGCPECGAPQVWDFAELRSCPACGWEDPVDDSD